MISANVLDYLISFLLYEVDFCPSHTTTHTPKGECKREQVRSSIQAIYGKPSFSFVKYGRSLGEVGEARVFIQASDFFSDKVYGTAAAEPELPLTNWEGTPLLFGEARHEWVNEGKTLVIYADIIASTYYLVSRYEEMTHRSQRDSLGRFLGRDSLPYRAGFLHRPIIEEYSRSLARLLEREGILAEFGLKHTERHGFARINLTHDLHSPFKHPNLYSLLRNLVVGKLPSLSDLWHIVRKPESDPYYTFDEIFELNHSLQQRAKEGQVHTTLYLKVPSHHKLDNPNYHLSHGYMFNILSKADKIQARFGLLCSYASSRNPHLIPEELKRLRHYLHRVHNRLYGWQSDCKHELHRESKGLKCTRDIELMRSRHNFLALGEPEDTREMIAAGIRHDYSMGYADIAGFRLGTCRAVRAINPNNRALTDLTMHPLTAMDYTLTNADAMALGEGEAFDYMIQLISQIEQYGGEVNLLWHNEVFSIEQHPWLGKLYRRLIIQLKQRITHS